MIKFEGYERRIDKIMGVLKEYGIASLEDAQKICLDKGVDCDAIVKGIQPIAFDNAVWAYTVGCAIAIKKNCKKAAAIRPQLQSRPAMAVLTSGELAMVRAALSASASLAASRT